MKSIILGLFFILFLFNQSEAAKNYGKFNDVEYVRNYDGDTVTFNIFDVHPIIGREISVRVYGIDTPEIRGKCQKEKELAIKAKNFVGNILRKAKVINLINVKRGYYFRIVATIIVDGKNLNVDLVKNHLAVLYYGKSARGKNWCNLSPE